jgi:uncharacterized protein (DUF1330 family)
MAAERRYVRVVGLKVDDDALYARYRAAMTPILHRFGGSFGYDMTVDRVLKSPSDKPIDRLFTIMFPSSEVADKFFAEPEYARVRDALFNASVSAITTIAAFEEAGSAQPV